jgi:hypothetical protein|mmetsp:Transcript_101795/g.172445  ORF Transcript_101795/g.172445 Transcript_101795/m.172445 type:complete len:82 (-) Transcript_101795:1890-2135(-)
MCFPAQQFSAPLQAQVHYRYWTLDFSSMQYVFVFGKAGALVHQITGHVPRKWMVVHGLQSQKKYRRRREGDTNTIETLKHH